MLRQGNFFKWILVIVLSTVSTCSLAQSPTLLRSTLSAGGSSKNVIVQGNSYLFQQSIGQQSIIGTVQTPGLELRQGFIQPLVNISKTGSTPVLRAAIFPIPFSTHLTIHFAEDFPEKLLITLSDILGRVVYSKMFEGQQKIFLEPDNLSSGYYTLRMYANEKIHTSKLIKE